MAIHTQQGVHVRILRKLNNGKVVVQDIDFPTWIRDYDIWRLRADGGIQEIQAAVKDAPTEHRGSRPITEIDPLFHDAAFRGFEPVTDGEKEALREKEGRR